MALADAFASAATAALTFEQIDARKETWFSEDFSNNSDYWGRPNKSGLQTQTVAMYNQTQYNPPINAIPLGMVSTWGGTPNYTAKSTNFLIAYTLKKLGYSDYSLGWVNSWSDFFGTSNDSAASISWTMGVDVAKGDEDYDAMLDDFTIELWQYTDSEKHKKLWPNLGTPENYILRSEHLDIVPPSGNRDLYFSSPGFLEITTFTP